MPRQESCLHSRRSEGDSYLEKPTPGGCDDTPQVRYPACSCAHSWAVFTAPQHSILFPCCAAYGRNWPTFHCRGKARPVEGGHAKPRCPHRRSRKTEIELGESNLFLMQLGKRCLAASSVLQQILFWRRTIHKSKAMGVGHAAGTRETKEQEQ